MKRRGEILTGDCFALMQALSSESIDAVVTDPPYGLEFMGREWDRLGAGAEAAPALRMQRWHEGWAREALRVAKPGAYLLAFGGTRTYHRLVSGIEDAGWEIRDALVWAYAEGFPKGLNIGRRIDMMVCAQPGRHYGGNLPPEAKQRPGDHLCPPSPDGDAHRGKNTTLKPAWEPIVLARKPTGAASVAENVLRYGTAGLNIDACRLPVNEADAEAWRNGGGYLVAGSDYLHGQSADFGQGLTVNVGADPSKGRWPANVILTDPVFDGGVAGVVGGGMTDRAWQAPSETGEYDATSIRWQHGAGRVPPAYGDTGTYSRFFLISKADRDDREPVLPVLPLRGRDQSSGKKTLAPRTNTHPTVKPVLLMAHLIRLVTPVGGTLLDPFLGSGTTAVAAEQEGYGWIGMEREEAYVAMARARLLTIDRGLGLDMPAPAPPAKASPPAVAVQIDQRKYGRESSVVYRGWGQGRLLPDEE